MKKFKEIDLNNWERSSHYKFFMENFQFPHTGITAPIDVTKLSKFCKSNEYSFFHACVHFISQTLNDIEEFRQRTRADRVVQWERVNPSYTVLGEERRFLFCDVEYTEDFEAFLKNSRQKSQAVLAGNFADDLGKEDDRLFMSCLPWISFTQMSHPVHSNKFDSTPRIAWGKVEETAKGLSMPLNIQAHHALVDGYHLGMAFEKFQSKINAL